VIGIFTVSGAKYRCSLGFIAIFALSPLGMVIDGWFTIESFMPHMAGYLLAAGSPVVGFLALGILLRRITYWKPLGNWLMLSSPLTLLLLILSLVTFDQTAVVAGHGIAGLTERILCVESLCFAISWLAITVPRSGPGEE
jgi:hypothetical protein